MIGLDDLSSGRIANLAEARSYEGHFTFHTIDIRSDGLRALFERHRPDVVMHLGAQTSVRRSVEDPRGDAEVNLVGLLNVLESAAATGVRKVVFASSGGTIYGEPRKLPVKETARRGSRPDSPYGVSKKAAEDYLSYFRRSRGVDYTALALANVYGPRQDPHGEAGVVSIFSGLMLEGEAPTIFGDGTQTRDYVYVEDAVHAFALSADLGSGMLVNVGTGIESSVNDIYRVLARITGYRGKPMFGPPRGGEVRRSALDVQLAAKELGWKPWTKLAEGLKATVEYLRSRRPG